jgi:hypothetical protein
LGTEVRLEVEFFSDTHEVCKLRYVIWLFGFYNLLSLLLMHVTKCVVLSKQVM